MLPTNSQAFPDGFGNVGLGFRFRDPLTHTSWDGRTFGNKDAVFVFGYGDQELHSSIV